MDNLDILTEQMTQVNAALAAKVKVLLAVGIPVKSVTDGDFTVDAEIDLGEKDGTEYAIQVGPGYVTLQGWTDDCGTDLADGMAAIIKKAREIFEV